MLPTTATPASPPAGDSSSSVGLSLLDLLYAVVAGDVLTRLSNSELGRVPLYGWGGLSVSLAIIVFSWMGYHRNRKLALSARNSSPVGAEKPDKRHSIGDYSVWDWQFLQFMIEVAILGVYFAMGLRVALPGKGEIPRPPSAFWPASCLVAVYALYLAWDFLDVALNRGYWRARAVAGMKVSAAFLVAFAGVLAGVWVSRPTGSGTVLGIDVVMVVLLYAYRALQEHYCAKVGTSAGAVTGTGT